MEWINKLTMEERWLYGIIITSLFTPVVGWTLNHLRHILTVRRDRVNSLRPHIIEFKSIFSAQISYINSDFSGLNMFSIDFYNTQTAIETIIPVLPIRYQRKLQKTWNKYCGKNNSLGLGPKEYVAETSNYTTTTKFKKFKKRFKHLYTSLDKLL